MEEIQNEVEEELLNKLNEIIKPLGMTPELLAEQFIRFCADPKNTEALRIWLMSGNHKIIHCSIEIKQRADTSISARCFDK